MINSEIYYLKQINQILKKIKIIIITIMFIYCIQMYYKLKIYYNSIIEFFYFFL